MSATRALANRNLNHFDHGRRAVRGLYAKQIGAWSVEGRDHRGHILAAFQARTDRSTQLRPGDVYAVDPASGRSMAVLILELRYVVREGRTVVHGCEGRRDVPAAATELPRLWNAVIADASLDGYLAVRRAAGR